MRRELIHELMCNHKLDLREFGARWEVDFSEHFAEDLRRLQQHVESGLARASEDLIEATPEGELFIRNVAMCFDTYWRDKHEGGDKPVFSRTV